MGFDKGAAELGGLTLVERAARTLASIAPRVVLACGAAPRYAQAGYPLLLDTPGLHGPAAALVAALEEGSAEWILALACDMPRVEATVFSALLEIARARGLDACMLASERGEEPLCGVYRRTLAPALRAAQAAQRLRVTAFRDFPLASGELPRVAAVTSGELLERGALDADRLVDTARNLNTPEDLLHERSCWSAEVRA